MDDFADLALSVHHIGGRAGTRCFPILPVFEHDIVNVLYEADRSSHAGIHEATENLPSKTFILGDCLSGKAGPRPFYLYSNRYLSSLYRLLPGHANTYSFDRQFGWDDDPGSKSLAETLRLDTVTLDQVMARDAGKIPPPNFLSLDTQGSELEILQGGTDTITNHVVAIMTEVEFVPVYEAQPLFGDVEPYLSAQGFELASLEVFSTTGTSNRTSVGLRGRGFTQGGEALFLRRLETLEDTPSRDVLLLKQAFIAFVFGFFDRTHQIASRLPDDFLAATSQNRDQTFAYTLFLMAYADIAKAYPEIFPIPYSDFFSAERSALRFQPNRGKIDREALRAAYFTSRGEDFVVQELSKLLAEEFVSIEIPANEFQLSDQAETLRRNRREQTEAVLKWLRIDQTLEQPSS
jgi:FkbM family methyltransferase